MFHHHHGIAAVHQLLQHRQKLLDVLDMQARGWLIHDVEPVLRGGAFELCGDLQPLGLAAREGRRRLAEPEIAEPDGGEQVELFG